MQVQCFWGVSRFCCFLVMWVLLICFLAGNESYLSGKVLQNSGVNEKLLLYDFTEGKSFETISNVREMWYFMEKVAFPTIYGYYELEPGANQTMRDVYDDGLKINPYLLGGVRVRQVRFESNRCKETPKGPDPYVCVSSYKTEESNWNSFQTVPYIEQPLQFYTAERAKDERTRGSTKWSFEGGGYLWNFPSLFAEEYTDAPDHTVPRFCANEYECGTVCSCAGTTGDSSDDIYSQTCFVNQNMPYALCLALRQLEALRVNTFADQNSRGVFFDWTAYGPTSQLHTVGRLVFEFRYGYVYPRYEIDTYSFQFSSLQFGFFFLLMGVLFLFFLFHAYELLLHFHILGCPGCINDQCRILNWIVNHACTNVCCPRRHNCVRHCWAFLFRDIGSVSKDLAEYELKVGAQRTVGRMIRCRFRICQRCCGIDTKGMEWEGLRFMRMQLQQVGDFRDDDCRLYLRIPFSGTTGSRIYLRLGHIKQIVERACHEYFGIQYSIAEREKSIVEIDILKPTSYGGIDICMFIEIPEANRDLLDKFDSFDAAKENQDYGSQSCTELCCGSADDPMSKQQSALETTTFKFDIATRRGQAADGLAMPQYATPEELRFCQILERELIQSLDVDPYLAEAKIMLYKPIRLKHCGQKCGRYWFGMALKIMYSSSLHIIDFILICLFSLYLWKFYQRWYSWDFQNLINPSGFQSFRLKAADQDRVRGLLFVLAFISSLRFIYTIVRLNGQAETFWDMLCYSMTQLVGFTFLIVFVLSSFAFSGWVLFGGQLREFGDPLFSAQTMLGSLVKDLPIDEMQRASAWGSLYYFLWFAFIHIMFLNIIIAILLQSWEKTAKEQATKTDSPENWRELNSHLQALFGHWRCCKNTNMAETRLQGGQFTGSPKEWQQVYPAGCPPDKLTTYLKKSWGVHRSVENILSIIDEDKGGTLSWEEIQDKLNNVAPNLSSGMFNLHDETHRRITRLANDLERIKEKVIEDKSWKTELINKFGLRSRHCDLFEKHGFDDQSTWIRITAENLKEMGFTDKKYIKKWFKGMCRSQLADMGIKKNYYKEFVKRGFQDVGRWKEIQDDELKAIGFKEGHILRWRKRFPYLNEKDVVSKFQGRMPFV